jgi:thiol-disulfide isomerase/thioredoxin
MAFDFKYPNVKGEEHSLSEYKGKYVYVDVWATWCGPCKAEIPSFKKLVEKFKGKNVVFISVSVDENKSDWETMLNEQQFSWIQLYAGGWNSSICKDYIIHSIPRFLLIDQDGKILDAEAPRPSGGIEKVLNELKGI